MAIATTPANIQDLMRKAKVKAEEGDYIEAIQHYDQVLLLQPTHAQALGDRGLVRANTGDRRGAMEDFRQAANLFLKEGCMTHYEVVCSYMKQI
ncbi:hypothetical protein GS597_15000 [Synechococcales cyanobacterium C]|uniref:Tetratricopeptide repeat protein n=1 Tax=Petrachloros mirabilis ULC683 TaxID=2781853 RepID=A0A8K2A197_9CYAN|nr:tetratricopeptide repeat protein [Petrachloros mirabilis]NCJ07793.1 hypothetical protein [Petrachloros mirabilis ULC683]